MLNIMNIAKYKNYKPATLLSIAGYKYNRKTFLTYYYLTRKLRRSAIFIESGGVAYNYKHYSAAENKISPLRSSEQCISLML